MSNSETQLLPAYVPEALAASNVGTWRTGHTPHHYIADETAAALFGLDPAQAAKGPLLLHYLRAVHPADHGLLNDKLNRVTEEGGLFVVEYRTMPPGGPLRWVLARGRYECDPKTGEMQGRGILIDITDSKLDGHAEDRAMFIKPNEVKHPLDRAAELAIETRKSIDEIEGDEGRALRNAVDALLWLLGRTLARRGIRRSFDT